MPVDILVFAVIAAFLAYRLHSVLGTRHGDERDRPNPFAPRDEQRTAGVTVDGRAVHVSEPADVVPAHLRDAIDPVANADGCVENGLADIAAADARFDLEYFLQGARVAFEWIVTAYAKGDRETLKPLLSPRLMADFDAVMTAREDAGRTLDFTLHRITAARIVEAHLGGTMAYVTVDFDAEETVVTRDRTGAVVEGDPNSIVTVADIWTFTRDIRAADPAWTLIETRAADRAAPGAV